MKQFCKVGAQDLTWPHIGDRCETRKIAAKICTIGYAGLPLGRPSCNEGHEDEVSSVAFSPEGARVLTGSYDKTARPWDISAIAKGSIFDIACAWLPDEPLGK
ncbi:MAG: WD40 repeat domain-containing protein [Beijerinckiaceae bacterium]